MLPKSKRLTKEDFTNSRPKIVFRGDLFDLAVVPIIPTKYACVISKKTLRRAVDRNAVKRKIFTAIRNNEIKSVSSCIIYPKKASLDTTYPQLEKEIMRAFATLH